MADESFDSIHWSMAMNGSSHDEGELTDDSETWIESSSEEEESSYDEDDPRWVSRTIVDIRPARTIENQRITIGDLQRVLDILRGEELEVRFAAKLGINVTIVTSTDTHHFLSTFQRRLPFQQVEETSGGAAPLSTGEIKVFLSDMRKDVPQIFCWLLGCFGHRLLSLDIAHLQHLHRLWRGQSLMATMATARRRAAPSALRASLLGTRSTSNTSDHRLSWP